MRKRFLAAVVVPLVVFTLGASANARPSSKFFFDGTTAQGLELFFIIDNSTGTMNFEPFFTNFTISCPDGTSFNFEWFFLNYQIPVVNKTFEISIPGTQIPFDWTGTLRGTTAQGVQSQGYASYDVNNVVQDCATGDVSWSAQGVGGTKPRTGPTATYVVTMTRDASGNDRQTITTG